MASAPNQAGGGDRLGASLSWRAANSELVPVPASAAVSALRSWLPAASWLLAASSLVVG